MDKIRRRGLMSGGMKIWIAVFLLGATAVYFVFFVVGPVYRTKWRLQDKMEELLLRYPYYDKNSPDGPEEAILTALQIDVDKLGLGFDTLEQFEDGSPRCFVQAKRGGFGEIWCDYDVRVRFLGQQRTMHMHAHYEQDNIPRESF